MNLRLWLLLLPLWLLSGKAKAEYYTITNYHVNVTFTSEGYADFEEIFDVQFAEPRHGIFRFIPYRDIIDGQAVNRIFEDVKVEGYKFSTSKENQNLVIKIGDANTYVEGKQVYRISYRVLNPLNFYKDHSEFFWDLLGISSPVATEKFSFTLNFPEQVSLANEDVRTATGTVSDSLNNLALQIRSRVIEGQGTKSFMPGEGSTIAVFFPGDTFKEMTGWEYFFKVRSLLLAPFIFLFGGGLARYIARNKRQTIMTEYFPPDGISPAIAGGFVDHSIDNNDVLCLIPHLANKGYLRLEVEPGGFLQKDNITFFKLKEAGPELFAFEKEFFNALFSTGSQVRLKQLQDKFYVHMSGVKTSVKAWITEQGWYEKDQQAFGCLTGISGLISLGWGVYAVFVRQNLDGFALIAAAFVLFFMASKFNKRSPLGNTTYQKLEGFRQFVKKAERPVIERLMKEDPLYYDHTMPFALAFGYLKQWNRQFDGLLSQPPSWYGGPMMYGTNMNQSWNTFSESFPSEINSISSVFSSSPSSSGSGGSGGGGGGFSGGGSGGGGTGSW